MKIGEFLITKNVISKIELEIFLEKQKNTGTKVGELIVNSGIISQGKMIEYLAELKNIKFVDMENFKSSKEAISCIDKTLCKKYNIYPLRIKKNGDKKTLYVAISDIEITNILDKLISVDTIDSIEAVLSSKASIIAAIRRDYEGVNIAIPGLNYEVINIDDGIIIDDDIENDGITIDRNKDFRNDYVNDLYQKVNNLEEEVLNIKKSLNLINKKLERNLLLTKEVLSFKKDNTIEKRIISITKLLIKKKIFDKKDFLEIFKKN